MTQKKPGVWRSAAPADETAIQRLLNESEVNLPVAYIGQLRTSNGGEGSLAVEPGWVSFWPSEEVVERNKGYEVAEGLPGFFGFGSNGGGELLAFKVADPERYPIYMIPFISMEEAYAERIAEDFEEFRKAIGYELENDE